MIISSFTFYCWFNQPWITGCALFLATNKGVTDFAYGQNLSSTCVLFKALPCALRPNHLIISVETCQRPLGIARAVLTGPPPALLHSSGAVVIVLAKYTGSLKCSGLLPEMRIGAPFIYQFNAKKTTKIKWFFRSRLMAQIPDVVKGLLPSLQNNLGSHWTPLGCRLNRRTKQLMSDPADCC